MMDKLKNQYILVTAVIVIWSIIGYQLFKAINPDEPVISYSSTKASIDNDTLQEINFELLANYRDPFGVAKKGAALPKVSIPVVNAPVKMNTPSVSVDWKALTFQGVVENNNSRSKVALVAGFGKSVLVKEGESIQDFKIISIWKDSILVESAGITKVFYKKR